MNREQMLVCLQSIKELAVDAQSASDVVSEGDKTSELEDLVALIERDLAYVNKYLAAVRTGTAKC